MMLSKPFISLIATIAAASTVAAAATPVARDGLNLLPPPTVPSVSQCNTGSVQCCNSTTSASDPSVAFLSGLLGLVPNLALPIGLTCTSVLLNSNQCNNSPVCCSNVYQQGLIAVGCSPINIGL